VCGRGGVPAAERHEPQLGEDGALQAHDEAVEPGAVGSGAGMPDILGGQGRVEGTPVLAVAVGPHPPEEPAGYLVDGEHPCGEETGRRLGGELGADLDEGVRAGRIAGSGLPDLAEPLGACRFRRCPGRPARRAARPPCERIGGTGPGSGRAGIARSAPRPSGRCGPAGPPAAERPAGLAYVEQGLRPGYRPQAESLYLASKVTGGRSSPSAHEGLMSNGTDMSYDPLSLSTAL
jgi:hypothetical protein